MYLYMAGLPGALESKALGSCELQVTLALQLAGDRNAIQAKRRCLEDYPGHSVTAQERACLRRELF